MTTRISTTKQPETEMVAADDRAVPAGHHQVGREAAEVEVAEETVQEVDREVEPAAGQEVDRVPVVGRHHGPVDPKELLAHREQSVSRERLGHRGSVRNDQSGRNAKSVVRVLHGRRARVN